MRYVKAAAILTPVGTLLIFIAQNTKVVDVRFLIWKVEMSRAVVLLGVLTVGFMLGWVTSSFARSRDRGSARQQADGRQT